MSLNLLRPKHLLKGVHAAASKFTKEEDDYSDDDSVNKYDSDEEDKKDSDSESQDNSDSEDEGNHLDNEDVTMSNEPNSPEEQINTFLFDCSEFPFVDSALVKELNSLSNDTKELNLFLVNLESKIFFEKNESNCKFFAVFFNCFLQKMFSIIKKSSINQDIIISFSLVNKIASIIIENNSNFKSQNENLRSVTLDICNCIINLYILIISVQTASLPDEFISSSLNYILCYLQSQNKENIKKKDEIKINKYMESINQLIVNLKQFSISFSLEQYKNIFNICFSMLKKHQFSALFVTIVDIICKVIEITDEVSFVDKFIESYLLCFDEFLSHYDYGNENYKYYILNNHLLKHYKYFFGGYKCLNGENISLFTYLFMRFFSQSYLKDDFIPVFEKFFLKLFEWNKPNILLSLHCLLNDLLKAKYNVEFCISLNFLLYFYLSLSNILRQNDIDINKKKYVMNLFDIFFDDLLKDFDSLKQCYLCFGVEAINNKKKKQTEKKKKCSCFSCQYSTVRKSETFHCQDCHWKTNLRLQVIDPDKDDNTSVCGFCNMKSFFESCGIIFEKENELKLVDTNEKEIEEYSKSKSKLKEEESKEEIQSRNLFDKFICYQDILFQNAFLFLKINLLNFIRISTKIENQTINNNIDSSFKIFLKNLITDQKMKNAVYKNFTQSVIQFYNVQKERIFNLHQDILIDDNSIKYFFFFHFYVNFLFAGHWKIIDIILTRGTNWALRRKALKILEKFILFEKDDVIFQNFDVNVLAPLLSDSSFNIRELSLNILFKLYQNRKIERGKLIYILYENINESSFLIRKRIVTALTDLVIKEDERENLKTIILVFLNKLNDNSESEKIKKLIYDYFIYSFKKSPKTKNELMKRTIKIFIELLKETENFITGNNFIGESIKKLFENIHSQISSYDIIMEDLTQKYLFNDNADLFDTIQCLNLIKIFSCYETYSVGIYIEEISTFLMFSKENENQNIVNRIIQIVCEIITNVFNETDENKTTNVKAHFVSKIENSLVKNILTKPIFVMISAIRSYFAILKTGLIDIRNIANLTLQNLLFLEKIYNDKEIDLEKYPLSIICKSLPLFSFVVYCLSEEQISMIFSNSKKKLIQRDNIIDYSFKIVEFFTSHQPISEINFTAFECLGFFWIKYPNYLNQSKDIITFIINNIQSEEDKKMVLRTFFNFFSNIKDKCKENQGQIEAIDFGGIHLFFDTFINSFSIFLVQETNPIIRIKTIHLLKLIIDLGNLNVHNILPHIFCSLFDSNNEVRFTAVTILEKIIKISSDKFFALLKEALKNSFYFQKKYYVHSKYINSFVKEIEIDNDAVKVINTSENVFELFNYKLSKCKSSELQRKFLEKFLSVLNDISSIESQFSNSSFNQIKECLDSFEFFEFVAKLIGDYRYSAQEDIRLVFDKLYPDFETDYCVFKSKLKSFRDESNPKMNMNLIYQFLVSGLKIFLLKFLEVKYEVFDDNDLETIHLKGWNGYKEDYYIKNESGEKEKKDKKKPKNIAMTQNEFKTMKFYEFYSIFEMYCKDIFSIQIKKNKKITIKDKNFLTNELLLLKNFYSLNLSRMKELLKHRKRKANMLNFLYDELFSLNKEEETKQFINERTNIKMRKRVTLSEKNDNTDTNIDSDIFKDITSKDNMRSSKKKAKRKIESKTEKKRKRRSENVIDEIIEEDF